MTGRRERRRGVVAGVGVVVLAMSVPVSAQSPLRAPGAPRVKNEPVIDLERTAQTERSGQWRFGERTDAVAAAPVPGVPAGEGVAARRPAIDLTNDQPPVLAGPAVPVQGTAPAPSTGPAIPGALAASLGIGALPDAGAAPAPPGDPGGSRALAELLKQRGETEVIARVASSAGRAQWRPAPPIGLPVAGAAAGGWTEVQPGQVIRGRVEVRTGVGSSVEFEIEGVGRVQVLRLSRVTLTGVRGAGAERALAAVDLSRGAVRIQPSAVMGGTLIASTPRQLWRVSRPMDIAHDLVTGTTATEPNPPNPPNPPSPPSPLSPLSPPSLPAPTASPASPPGGSGGAGGAGGAGTEF